jgi:hypothetical protein
MTEPDEELELEEKLVDSFMQEVQDMSPHERHLKRDYINEKMNEFGIGLLRLRDGTVYTLVGW